MGKLALRPLPPPPQYTHTSFVTVGKKAGFPRAAAAGDGNREGERIWEGGEWECKRMANINSTNVYLFQFYCSV